MVNKNYKILRAQGDNKIFLLKLFHFHCIKVKQKVKTKNKLLFSVKENYLTKIIIIKMEITNR